MRKFTSWAVALAVLVIVVFNVQGWLVFARTSRVLEQELGDRLQAVATTLAAVLGGGPVEELDGSRGLLEQVMRDNRLFNLFVVDERLEYVVNLRNAEFEGTGDPSLDLDMGEILAAFSGLPTQSRLYRAGGYFLKSAYAPVLDRSGVPVVVLGVEADAGFFSVLITARNSMLLVNGLSLLAIAVLVFSSVGLARHALRVEQAASRANTLALMGQMSAAVAHEIKNPLAVIRSTAERLRTKYGSSAPDDPTFGYIEEEVDRLDRVVSNYLGLGRYRPGEVEQLDIAEVAAEVAASLEHQARRRGVDIRNAAAALPELRGNRIELRQVLMNLVLNGIQAQPDGGRVEIRGRVARRQGRRWVVVEVADDGPGIGTKERARVFEPFYTTKEKGSGLGLFVVRRIVEAHGGQVGIESPGGAGTVVQVRLPA